MKKNTADKWFSLFIRLRDCIWGEYGPCITCKKPTKWNEGDCGHFATRDRPMTRYDDRNCHLQCPTCNRFKSGEQAKHGFAIDEKYGPGTAKELIELSEIRGQKVHTKVSLKEIATKYRLKAKELAKERGVTI